MSRALALQRALCGLGYPVATDGQAGPLTAAAVAACLAAAQRADQPPRWTLYLPAGVRVSSGYGWRGAVAGAPPHLHAGIDVALSAGAPVAALSGGRVVVARDLADGYGLQVVLDHGDGTGSRYAHLSAIHATAGATVDAGDVIGAVGSTGRSTGAHLHLELLAQGRPVDPAGWLAVVWL